uniref:Major sperm protein n=1 Tax=Parascaris univalens TaxID=6257 RepID=A0A914ZXW3_PARUN
MFYYRLRNDWVIRHVISATVLVLLSTYLTYGHHPQLVCNTLATIAAAMFTRDLLSGPLPECEAQNAVLLYWLTYGILLYFDSTFAKVPGYFLAKFVLLCTLLFNAMRCCGRDNRHYKFTSNNAVNTKPSFNNPSAPDSLTTIGSASRSNTFQSRSSTPYEGDSTDVKAITVIQTDSKESETKTICDLIYGDSENETTADISTTTALSRFEPSSLLSQEIKQHAEQIFDDAGDRLFTTPEEIIFKSSFIDIVTLLVTNAYNKPIMWALKTNAIHQLVAQPTCGVLQPNSTIQVRVGIIERLSRKQHISDRLVIEYSLVDEGVVAFDRGFLKRTSIPRRRKKISVSYVF